MALYQLRRYTPDLPTEGKYEIIRTGPSRESLSDLLDHYLAGPDGPVVGSRYADYRIVVTRIDDAEDDIDAAIADAERQVEWCPALRNGIAVVATVSIQVGVVEHSITRGDREDYAAHAEARRQTVAADPLRRKIVVDALKAAGYTFDAETCHWRKDGFTAVAHGYDWGGCRLHIYRADAWIPCASTPSHPAESLAYGR